MTGFDGIAALPVCLPIYSEPPWISDGAWIAHDTLPVFAGIAGMTPGPGTWVAGDDGLISSPEPAPDLAGTQTYLAGLAGSCVLADDTVPTWTVNEIIAGGRWISDPVEVLDSGSGLWRFDPDLVAAAKATSGEPRIDWSWRIAVTGPDTAILLGFADETILFSLANLSPRTHIRPH